MELSYRSTQFLTERHEKRQADYSKGCGCLKKKVSVRVDKRKWDKSHCLTRYLQHCCQCEIGSLTTPFTGVYTKQRCKKRQWKKSSKVSSITKLSQRDSVLHDSEDGKHHNGSRLVLSYLSLPPGHLSLVHVCLFLLEIKESFHLAESAKIDNQPQAPGVISTYSLLRGMTI